MDISKPYYSDFDRISNSNIGWFLKKGPSYLHKMLTDPPPEEKNPVLERGTMIHMYILQPEEFQKTYVVWDKSRPSSVQQEKFCQALANSVEIEPNKAVLSAYKEAYSTAGKSDDKMLSEGLKIASTLKDYIVFLKEKDERTMIGPWDIKMLEKIKHNIDSHKLARVLLSPEGKTHTLNGDVVCSIHNEFHINWEYEELVETSGSSKSPNIIQVHCKSLLDRIIFNFDTKVCTIIDLKTTQKLWNFEESMNQYDYVRQLCYYMHAAKWYLKEECSQDVTDWDFKFYIIGIDTTGSYDIRVFEIQFETVLSHSEVIHTALYEIFWHQLTNKWDHSRAYYEGDGSETLKL